MAAHGLVTQFGMLTTTRVNVMFRDLLPVVVWDPDEFFLERPGGPLRSVVVKEPFQEDLEDEESQDTAAKSDSGVLRARSYLIPRVSTRGEAGVLLSSTKKNYISVLV